MTDIATGEINEGKVYINFPFPVVFMSGYYGCDELEELAREHFKELGLIRPFISDEIKKAVTILYENNDREMSETVKSFMSVN